MVARDVERGVVRIPGAAGPITLRAHEVVPASPSPPGGRPVVLFLHGFHDGCYTPGESAPVEEYPCRPPAVDFPNHLGYAQTQELLASRGYVTLSIDANAVGAQDDGQAGGAPLRGHLVKAHLAALARDAAAVGADPRRVMVVGHSRGGEGVADAAATVPPGAPYRIVGAVYLGS